MSLLLTLIYVVLLYVLYPLYSVTHIYTHTDTRTQFYSIFCQVRHVPILLHKLQK